MALESIKKDSVELRIEGEKGEINHPKSSAIQNNFYFLRHVQY